MPSFRSTVSAVQHSLARFDIDVRDIPVTRVKDIGTFVGLYWPDENKIEIRAGLVGCALWRVLLHEYGHALGLGHTKSGLMGRCRYTKADFSDKEPTERQQKVWTTELVRLVLKDKEKKWRARK